MEPILEQTRRNQRRLAWLAAGLVLPPVLLAVAILAVRPGAPRAIRLYTGPAGSVDAAPGERFATIVRARGLEVELIPTGGPEECLRRVAEAPGDAAALIVGGAEGTTEQGPGRNPPTSLGTVAVAPLWLFVAPSVTTGDARELAGRRVGSGPAESVSGLFATLFFRDNGEDPASIVRLPFEDDREAVAALDEGRLEAVFVAGLPGSPAMRSLLDSPTARPLSFPRAEAYRVRHPWLRSITVPRGAFDLGADRPPTDLQSLAAGINLVAPKRMHPAAVRVLLDAARESVRGGTEQSQRLIAERLDLPTPEHTTLPINAAAQAYYDQRREQDVKYLLFRILPYGVARWVDRWGILLVALAASLLLLVKVLPGLTKANFTLRLNRAYREMGEVEKAAGEPGADRAALLARLDEVDRASLPLPVPWRLGAEYIDFRQFLHDLRSRVENLPEREP